jgi:hypothetical protein
MPQQCQKQLSVMVLFGLYGTLTVDKKCRHKSFDFFKASLCVEEYALELKHQELSDSML